MGKLSDERFRVLRERMLRAGVAPRHVRRYLAELRDHLADLTAAERAGGKSDAAEAAALARLGGVEALAGAMIGRREFQGWAARAPWAVFGLGTVASVSLLWLMALGILWMGWRMFLPGAETPFGGHGLGGVANLWFQCGKALYFGGPVLAGWMAGVMAVRQRVGARWVMLGMVVPAWMGATALVQASRTAVGGFWHISFRVGFWPAGRGLDRVEYAAMILALTLVPYAVWRWREAAVA